MRFLPENFQPGGGGGIIREELEEVTWEREVWVTLLKLLHPLPDTG